MEHKIIPVQGGQPPSQGMTWKEFNTSLDEIVTTSSERLRKKLFKEAEVAARFDGYRDTVPLMRLSRILSTNCLHDETLHICCKLTSTVNPVSHVSFFIPERPWRTYPWGLVFCEQWSFDLFLFGNRGEQLVCNDKYPRAGCMLRTIITFKYMYCYIYMDLTHTI